MEILHAVSAVLVPPLSHVWALLPPRGPWSLHALRAASGGRPGATREGPAGARPRPSIGTEGVARSLVAALNSGHLLPVAEPDGGPDPVAGPGLSLMSGGVAARNRPLAVPIGLLW